MVITENTTVADIASTIPSSVRIFQRHGIDFCCGGKTPLAVACRERGVPFTEIATTIEASIESGRPDERNWTREPLHVLVDHIVATYHEPLREELPRLESMAAKVLRVHGLKAPYLGRVEALLMELAADLRLHMQKEECVLFPAIRAIEGGAHSGMPISAPIVVMEHGTQSGRQRAGGAPRHHGRLRRTALGLPDVCVRSITGSPSSRRRCTSTCTSKTTFCFRAH